MKISNISDTEAEILDLVEFYLKGRLKHNGLSYDPPSYNRKWDDGKYYSEICSYVYRNNSIIDAIEFPVFQSNRLVATKEEIRMWLQNTADDIVEKYI